MKTYLIFLLLISGCTPRIEPVTDYSCTKEQFSKVEEETNFCSSLAGNVPNICYEAAISRNCKLKEK